MRYSLTDYLLTIKLPEEIAGYTEVTIGGEGSYLESININPQGTLYTTEADDTGAWIHSKSLDRHGQVQVSLNQLSEKSAILRNLCNCFYNHDYDKGMTITVQGLNGNTVATCNDCYIANMPSVPLQNRAQNQTWTFTCGQIFID